MREWRQTVSIVIMVMILMYVVTGCGKVNASPVDMDMISITSDGKIEQTIVDEFDQNYYSIDELSEMTQNKIALYIDEKEDIVCDSIEEKDGMVVVKLVYKTGEYYTDFNGKEFYFGTVKEAAGAGYSIKAMVSNDGNSLTDEEYGEIEDSHVVIIQTEAGEELGVNVYDKILYMSEGVVSSGKNDAIIEAGEEDKLSCIVFK